MDSTYGVVKSCPGQAAGGGEGDRIKAGATDAPAISIYCSADRREMLPGTVPPRHRRGYATAVLPAEAEAVNVEAEAASQAAAPAPSATAPSAATSPPSSSAISAASSSAVPSPGLGRRRAERHRGARRGKCAEQVHRDQGNRRKQPRGQSGGVSTHRSFHFNASSVCLGGEILH